MNPERTEAQREAPRVNVAKFQGPNTQRGRQRSSQNRTTHGLYSKTFTCVSEDHTVFQARLDEYRGIYQPATSEEDDLVRALAGARFRIDRMDAIVTALFDMPLAGIVEPYVEVNGHGDPVLLQAMAFKASVDASPAIANAHRMMLQFDRLYHRNRAALEHIQKLRENAVPPEPTPAPSQPAKPGNERFKPEDDLGGMTAVETINILRRDRCRPDTVDTLLGGPHRLPDAA